MDTSEVWKLFFEAYFIVEIKKKTFRLQKSDGNIIEIKAASPV